MRDVILNWQLGTNFGWGLLGLNLFAHWANDTDIRPLMGLPIEPSQLGGIDALRMWRVLAAAQASNAQLKLHNENPSSILPAVCIDALGNDLRSSNNRRARLMIGRAIFESLPPEIAQERLAPYDLILTASNWNARLIKQATGRDACIIHEGVDVSLFFPGPRCGWLDENRFYVFSGGKIEFRKGQDLALLAFRRFAARHPDAVLVTAWHSPWINFSLGFRGRLESPLAIGADGTLDVTRWAVQNGIDAAQVIDLGSVPNVLLPGILREMHVALQPSRAEACTNLPVKEAMACGVPVIAAPNTGMLDLLTHDNCILLRRQTPVCIPNEAWTEEWGESDVEEIDAALEFSYQDRNAAAATGARGRQWLLDHGRTWQRHAATLKEWVISQSA